MKKQHIIPAVVFFAFIATTLSFAEGNKLSKTNSNYNIIEANYLEGLKSDNIGLRMSCAYFLGEIKSAKAVIPLMHMLNTEEHEGARIIAAWSLVKIGDSRGIYLVKRQGEQCKDCSVKSMCQYFYNHFNLTTKGKLDLE